MKEIVIQNSGCIDIAERVLGYRADHKNGNEFSMRVFETLHPTIPLEAFMKLISDDYYIKDDNVHIPMDNVYTMVKESDFFEFAHKEFVIDDAMIVLNSDGYPATCELFPDGVCYDLDQVEDLLNELSHIDQDKLTVHKIRYQPAKVTVLEEVNIN